VSGQVVGAAVAVFIGLILFAGPYFRSFDEAKYLGVGYSMLAGSYYSRGDAANTLHTLREMKDKLSREDAIGILLGYPWPAVNDPELRSVMESSSPPENRGDRFLYYVQRGQLAT